MEKNDDDLPTGWTSARSPENGRIYYYKRGDLQSSVWSKQKIPGYVSQKEGSKTVPKHETSKKAPGHKTLHHVQQSFVSKRITKLQVGLTVLCRPIPTNRKYQKLQGKIGYITCVLGRSCMVRVKNEKGQWNPIEELLQEKELRVLPSTYSIGDNIEIIQGKHEGSFATIAALDGEEHVHVRFWLDVAKQTQPEEQIPLHRFKCTQIRTTVEPNNLMTAYNDDKPALVVTASEGGGGGGGGETKSPSHLPAPQVNGKDIVVEVHQQTNSAAVAAAITAVVVPVSTVNVGDQVQLTNACMLVPHKKQERDRLFVLSGKTGTVRTVGVGPDCQSARVEFSNFGGPFTQSIRMSYLKIIAPSTGVPTATATVVDRAPKTFPAGTCLQLNPRHVLNDPVLIKTFPWDEYMAVGYSVGTSAHTNTTVIKYKKNQGGGFTFQHLPPFHSDFFVRFSRNRPTRHGLPPTDTTASPQIMQLYKEACDAKTAAAAKEAGNAVWVTDDKIEFDGTMLKDIDNSIPTVDAFYIEEPPVVVIATRIIEQRKKERQTNLWDMPSDTWLELAVYVHSFYKKFDKRKGMQTFKPAITGHVPTTREGRDRIMPPKATRDIMRRYISNDLFLNDKEKKQVITINTQSGFSTRKLRGKLTPEEPANGKYEYQEQQLQKYLMRRYVNNNWCCKHFAPPHPDCGLWGNYDANTQGWCCWGCKAVLPISLFLLVLSYAMLSAAATSDYIISMNLNEQEENIFCSRLNTTATSSVVTLFPCTGTSLSSLTMKVSTYNKVDALVDGVMDSEVASAFQITDRAQQLRLGIYAGESLTQKAMFQPLTTTVATPVVGAVKVGYELNALGDVGYNPPSPYSYPPTVVPLNTQHLMDSTSSDTYQGKSGGLWSFSDRYKASMAAKNVQRSGVSNNWAAIPFTPSCTRTYEGNVNAFALPDTPYSCTEQPTSDTVARRTGRNAQGYKVELTADRTCLDQGIPLDQCLEYGESNAYVGEGREGREGRKPWVWGVSEGCLYGANGCQGPYHSEYAAMPYVDTTSTTSTGHAYTLPPANYPGYNPPKGQYSLRFTALVVRVEFAAVVGDSTRVEVQEWLTGTGKYAGVEGKGALRNSLVFDVLQHETQQYGWFVFAMGMTCFTVVFVLAVLQCIEECQIYGSRGGGGTGGTGGTGGNGNVGGNNDGCCDCNHCYWDSSDCAYCYFYNHGGSSRYSSYNGGYGGSSNNCNHCCDGCCNCDCETGRGGCCDNMGCNDTNCCKGCNGNGCSNNVLCQSCDSCANGCCPSGEGCDCDCGQLCGNQCAGGLCGGCEDVFKGCGDCVGSGCKGCEQCGGSFCEGCGNCLNGGCEGLGSCCEAGCDCVGSCGNCGDCGGCNCGGCDCAC